MWSRRDSRRYVNASVLSDEDIFYLFSSIYTDQVLRGEGKGGGVNFKFVPPNLSNC